MQDGEFVERCCHLPVMTYRLLIKEPLHEKLGFGVPARTLTVELDNW